MILTLTIRVFRHLKNIYLSLNNIFVKSERGEISKQKLDNSVESVVVLWQSIVFVVGQSLVREQIVLLPMEDRLKVVNQISFVSDNQPKTKNSENGFYVGNHLLLTCDSDGEFQAVLTGTNECATDILHFIVSNMIELFEFFWKEKFGLHLYMYREWFIESLFWLLHRTSSFDVNVSEEEMNRIRSLVKGFFGIEHAASSMVLSCIALLTL